VIVWVLVAASAARASRNVAMTAGLLALTAAFVGVGSPGSLLPGVLAVEPPSGHGLEEVVSLEPGVLNVFLVKSWKDGQLQRAATLKADSPEHANLDPPTLAAVLTERFAKEGKKPVKIWIETDCKDDKKPFVAAVASATSAAGVSYDEGRLPIPDDYAALRKLNHQERLRPFQEGAYASTAARFAAAIALALAVWWADARGPRARAAGVLTAGSLVLALAQVLSLPLVLYLGILSEKTAPSAALWSQAVTPHVFLLVLSAIGLVAGGIVTTVGLLLMPDVVIEEPKLSRPRLSRPGTPAPATAAPAPPAATPASVPEARRAPGSTAAPPSQPVESPPAPPSPAS